MKATFLILFLGLISCKANQPSEAETSSKKEVVEINDPCSESINQGITGKITFLEGNVAPEPGSPEIQGKPVQREVWFFPPLERTKTPSEESVFFKVDTNLAVAHQLSGKDGCYKIRLEPGLYSVLISEPDKGFFASIFNRRDYIQSVMVEQGKLAKLDIEINYKASY